MTLSINSQTVRSTVLLPLLLLPLSSQALVFGTDTVDIDLTISGSTSMDKQVIAHIGQLCDMPTLDTYYSYSRSAYAFFCHVPAANSGLSGDRQVLFRMGGSSSGEAVDAIVGSTPVPQLDLASCSETSAGSQRWSCSDTLVTGNAHIGISNVEPEAYRIITNGAYSNADIDMVENNLVRQPINADAFGVVVSTSFYEALQEAQGLSPLGSTELSAMPSLSSPIIREVFAGNIGSWDQLKDANGIGITSAYNASHTDNISTDVNACYRSSGSGTGAQFNSIMMQQACRFNGLKHGLELSQFGGIDQGGVIDAPYIPPSIGFTLPSPYTHATSSAEKMGECITDLASRDNWAIGYQPLSMVDEGREHYNQFKFIAIDKITPTLENIAAGLYPYWSASYIFWHNTGLSTEQEQLANSFVGGLKSPSLIQAANAALQQDNADDNFDDRPVSGYRTPEILDNGNPANVGTLVFSDNNATPPIQASFPFNPNNPVMNLKKMYLCQMPRFSDAITEHDVSR